MLFYIYLYIYSDQVTNYIGKKSKKHKIGVYDMRNRKTIGYMEKKVTLGTVLAENRAITGFEQ